ncbi:hypothetical protein [Pseudomonas schmalbachii]|uniref:Secreted protein n=1 Tax=Pseudomonas schmalbachii TaxID=2816993 RepID=A0ABS3TQR9_9PSED|nr:hypothetical protein [Pseudomonas schmalbachii]MBO3276001.1 hypothetical protein [Pseudomonas schmalbachii]
MSRTTCAAALLALCSFSFAQLSFAEESPLMADKLVKANHEALAAQQTGAAAERTAGQTVGDSRADS